MNEPWLNISTGNITDDTGRYIMHDISTNVTPLGESRSLAVRRFKAFERLLRAKSQLNKYILAMREYFQMGHAHPFPHQNWKGPATRFITCWCRWSERSVVQQVKSVLSSMLPWRARPEHHWTINYSLDPRSTQSLVDVLLRFRRHKVALTKDVSWIYRPVLLPNWQHDLHRLLWSEDPETPQVDYQMMKLTFGMSASLFATNMAMKQNTLKNVDTHPHFIRKRSMGPPHKFMDFAMPLNRHTPELYI